MPTAALTWLLQPRPEQTFEERIDGPGGDRSNADELSESEFHKEQRKADECQRTEVRNQKRTCLRQRQRYIKLLMKQNTVINAFGLYTNI